MQRAGGTRSRRQSIECVLNDFSAIAVAVVGFIGLISGADAQQPSTLSAGFAEVDITPQLADDRPVWLAGYGPGRRATKVHDPIMARCVALKSAGSSSGEVSPQTIVIMSVDLIGLQLPDVQRVRRQLPGVQHLVISSTHNHEGPDVIGLWGESVVKRGVDSAYVDDVVEKLVALATSAVEDLQTVGAVRYGAATDEALLRDSRQPYVKDATLRLMRFEDTKNKLIGAVVQWNCHPEAMGSKNQELTADFTGVTVKHLKSRWQAPVVLISGAVGGLMAPPSDFPGFRRQDAKDRWEYMTEYGKAVAGLADQAMTVASQASVLRLTPFRYTGKPVAIPIDNAYYRTAQSLGVLRRQQAVWMDDLWNTTERPSLLNQLRRRAIVTEVGWLECGELLVACVPGEIYPELVTGKFQDPVEPNADYPDAPREPTVVSLVGERPWMLFGLCNDEVGYIIPKSQWDQKSPFAYGRRKSQYGEINSCSVEAGPIIMEALRKTLPTREP